MIGLFVPPRRTPRRRAARSAVDGRESQGSQRTVHGMMPRVEQRMMLSVRDLRMLDAEDGTEKNSVRSK